MAEITMISPTWFKGYDIHAIFIRFPNVISINLTGIVACKKTAKNNGKMKISKMKIKWLRVFQMAQK